MTPEDRLLILRHTEVFSRMAACAISRILFRQLIEQRHHDESLAQAVHICVTASRTYRERRAEVAYVEAGSN